MAGQVTLAQVARAAGVSLATASRALNGSAGRTVGADLAARVLAAATALGYTANAHAQAMARGTTTTVGLLVHDIADPFAAAIASGVMAAAAERGLIVSVAATLSDPALELRQLEALLRQRATAVILAGSRFADPDAAAATAQLLRAVGAAGGHVATIGQDRLGCNTLAVDNAGGARHLAQTLTSLGYSRFAVLAGPEQLLTCEDRLTGFREGLAESGVELPAENILGAQDTRDGGYVAMTELLDRGFEVDAVFAVNDVMAVGAMAALREQGYHVPHDLALAGFDDVAMLRDVEPPLTTVRIPLIDLGREALELAMSTDPTARPTVRPVSCEVVVRASTPARPPLTARRIPS